MVMCPSTKPRAPVDMAMGSQALGCFVGGQALGIVLDVVKTRYDIKRNGQQSAIH